MSSSRLSLFIVFVLCLAQRSKADDTPCCTREADESSTFEAMLQSVRCCVATLQILFVYGHIGKPFVLLSRTEAFSIGSQVALFDNITQRHELCALSRALKPFWRMLEILTLVKYCALAWQQR